MLRTAVFFTVLWLKRLQQPLAITTSVNLPVSFGATALKSSSTTAIIDIFEVPRFLFIVIVLVYKKSSVISWTRETFLSFGMELCVFRTLSEPVVDSVLAQSFILAVFLWRFTLNMSDHNNNHNNMFSFCLPALCLGHRYSCVFPVTAASCCCDALASN